MEKHRSALLATGRLRQAPDLNTVDTRGAEKQGKSFPVLQIHSAATVPLE